MSEEQNRRIEQYALSITTILARRLRRGFLGANPAVEPEQNRHIGRASRCEDVWPGSRRKSRLPRDVARPHDEERHRLGSHGQLATDHVGQRSTDDPIVAYVVLTAAMTRAAPLAPDHGLNPPRTAGTT